MKRLIIKILLRLLCNTYYKPLSKEEVDFILIKLSDEDEFEKLPAFLESCANQYRNQYLYTGNEMFKGSVLAFSTLREQILEKRKQKKNTKKNEDLTENKKSGKMVVSY